MDLICYIFKFFYRILNLNIFFKKNTQIKTKNNIKKILIYL